MPDDFHSGFPKFKYYDYLLTFYSGGKLLAGKIHQLIGAGRDIGALF